MVEFQDGVLEKEGYVEVNGVKIKVHMPKYTGRTPLSSENLNKLQKDLQMQINSLASGSPLVASSADEMMDTTRVYVNKTDGNWYYHNGTNWQSGGVYQSTAIGENIIHLENLNIAFKGTLENDYKKISIESFSAGYYTRNKILADIENTARKHVILDVYPNEKFLIKGNEYGTMPLYILLDKNENVVSYFPIEAGAEINEVEKEIVIPSNVTKMIVNNRATSKTEIVKIYKCENIKLKNEIIDFSKLDTELKGNFEAITEEIDTSNIEYINGYLSRDGMKHKETTSTTYMHKYIPLEKGARYLLDAYSFSNIPCYFLVDNIDTACLEISPEEQTSKKVKYENLEICANSDNVSLCVHKIGDSEFTLKKVVGYSPKTKKVYNPLEGKIAVFDGDSICDGIEGIDRTSPYYGYGWAGRIGQNNDMVWKNYGKGGGTVTTGTYAYTTADTTTLDWENNTYYIKNSNPTSTTNLYIEITEAEWNGINTLYTRNYANHWESTNIETIYQEYPNADYVILESCLNDCFKGVPKGEISQSYTEEFDTTNFAGAMEYMLNKAITLYPTAKIGVVIPPRVTKSTMNEYHEITRNACKKWGIPFIDLYYKSGLCVDNLAHKETMFVDGHTHLSNEGYDFIVPKIESWMKSL